MSQKYQITLRTNSGKKNFKQLELVSIPTYIFLINQVRKLFRIKNKKQTISLFLDLDIPAFNLTSGTILENIELENIFIDFKTNISVALDNEPYQKEIITEKIEIKKEVEDTTLPVLFWRDTDSNGYLSNWKKTPFVLNDVHFNSVEQSLMYHKAMYAEQMDIAQQILGTPSPQKQKKLGRQVNDFLKGGIWRRKRTVVLYNSLWAKFTQNPELGICLKKTYPRRIGEASPSDTLYGIGLAPSNDLAQDPKCWKGNNLLGKALEQVREKLMED